VILSTLIIESVVTLIIESVATLIIESVVTLIIESVVTLIIESVESVCKNAALIIKEKSFEKKSQNCSPELRHGLIPLWIRRQPLVRPLFSQIMVCPTK